MKKLYNAMSVDSDVEVSMFGEIVASIMMCVAETWAMDTLEQNKLNFILMTTPEVLN